MGFFQTKLIQQKVGHFVHRDDNRHFDFCAKSATNTGITWCAVCSDWSLLIVVYWNTWLCCFMLLDQCRVVLNVGFIRQLFLSCNRLYISRFKTWFKTYSTRNVSNMSGFLSLYYHNVFTSLAILCLRCLINFTDLIHFDAGTSSPMFFGAPQFFILLSFDISP